MRCLGALVRLESGQRGTMETVFWRAYRDARSSASQLSIYVTRIGDIGNVPELREENAQIAYLSSGAGG